MLKPLALKNGLTVLKYPKNSSNVFLVGFVIPTGSSIEQDNFPQGVSYLIERLFWCGTDKHPNTRNLNTALESIGGNFYSVTGHEMTQYYLVVPSYHQYKAISMLAEVIQRSFFDTRDIEREKRAVLEQVKLYDDGITGDDVSLGLSNVFAHSSYGLPIKGSLDTVMGITQEDILHYLSHQYQPNKSYLILGGNFDNKAATELIEQEWLSWSPKRKEFINLPHVTELPELPKIVYKQRGYSQTQVSIGFLLHEGYKALEHVTEESTPTMSAKELEQKRDHFLASTATLLVLCAVLGQGLSSRLWIKGVEEEMLFSTIGSDIVRFESTGFLQISGITDNSQFTFALECVFACLEALKKTTISINELSKVKEFAKGKLLAEQEDLLTAVTWQAEQFLLSGLEYELHDLIEYISKVETAQVRALASDLFSTDRLFITTVGTAKETRIVDKLINKYLS